eukprot:3706024-Amphidinium_carterae.1
MAYDEQERLLYFKSQLQKRVLVGDKVVVENVSKGVAKPSDLGMSGIVKEWLVLCATVRQVYVPEKAVVKETWCRAVITVEQDGFSSHEAVNLCRVVLLAVDLRAFDRA